VGIISGLLLSARLGNSLSFEQPEGRILETMPQLFVRSLDRTFVVSVEENSTVEDLKAAIENVEFIPCELQRLVCGTTAVASGNVFDLLEEEDTVTLLLNVNGGMRAKWRKKRMRRLRRKRRKMRQRAR
jgi:hypothetical protein